MASGVGGVATEAGLAPPPERPHLHCLSLPPRDRRRCNRNSTAAIANLFKPLFELAFTRPTSTSYSSVSPSALPSTILLQRRSASSMATFVEAITYTVRHMPPRAPDPIQVASESSLRN